MKLAIVGSRTFNNWDLMIDIFNQHFPSLDGGWDIDMIISGGAKGADEIAYYTARNHHIPYKEFIAEWEKYGKSAGYKRNKQIVDACDMVLAFWDGKSKGTQHTINLAKEAKKPTFIVYF
ncbi:MAG: SLOG family protein [Candidatus Thorarchaeota archaeon]